MNNKIKGTNEGFKAENLIEKYLNNKIISNIQESNLKKFILSICKENRIEIKNDTKIEVKKVKKIKLNTKGSLKVDRVFLIENKEFRISIKSGIGNSFHEEKEKTFLNFLKNKLNASDEILTFLKKFLSDRSLTNKDLKNSKFSKLLKKHKQIVIDRVLSGIYGEPKVNYYCFLTGINRNDTEEKRIRKIESCSFGNQTFIFNYINNN